MRVAMMVVMRDAALVQSRVRLVIIFTPRRCRRLHFALGFEAPFDARVFPVGFDLFDFERDAQPLGEIAFGDRVIARFRAAGVEVLVIPEVWGRDDGACLPINLHRIVRLLEAVLAREREAAAVERENDRFVRVTMAELVSADLELGHMWFENRIARHLPKHTGVARAALFPQYDFGRANVFDEIGFVPTLAHAFGLAEVVGLLAVAIREIEVELVDQLQAAEDLQHERKRRHREQPRRMRRVGIEVAVINVHRRGEQAAFAPFDLVPPLALAEDRVAATAERVIKLLEEIAARGQGFALGNLQNHAVHVNVAGEIEIQAAPFDLRPWPRLLILRVVDRVALDHRRFARLDPIAIEIALDAPAAADVRGAELFSGLLFAFVFLLVYWPPLRRRVS